MMVLPRLSNDGVALADVALIGSPVPPTREWMSPAQWTEELTSIMLVLPWCCHVALAGVVLNGSPALPKQELICLARSTREQTRMQYATHMMAWLGFDPPYRHETDKYAGLAWLKFLPLSNQHENKQVTSRLVVSWLWISPALLLTQELASMMLVLPLLERNWLPWVSTANSTPSHPTN
jgi:hypothetical protein